MSAETFEDAFARLRAAFALRLADDVDAMETAVLDNRWDDVAAQAHILAGRGGTFGAADISEAASRIEEAALAGDGSRARDAIAHMRALL